MKVLQVLAVVVSLVCFAIGCQPIFRLYESRGYGDEYVENAVELVTTSDVFDIEEHGFIHSRMYTCPQGVWLGYEFEGFAGSNNLVFNYRTTGGVHHCSYENLGRYFKSLKIVGDPHNYQASALVTFQARWNEMASTTYLNDTEQIFNTRFNSLILMGNQEMEIFTGPNFTGTSFCVGPNNGIIPWKYVYDQVNNNRNGTHLYTNLADLQDIFSIMEFHSFRFGCSSNNKMK